MPISFLQNANALEQADRAGSTTTYLRCWHRVVNNHNKPFAERVWGKNADGSRFVIPGYWYDPYSLDNMFYTSLKQKELKEACLRAVPKTANQNEVLMYAADDNYSFNNKIWFNDQMVTNKINKIVSFGDSLSDTGNLFNKLDWRYPNLHSWFVGHFSNGLTWTEYLANKKGIPLYSWAVGGAAGKKEDLIIDSIHSQVQSFLKFMKRAEYFSYENTLLVLEFGLNDFITYFRKLEDTENDFRSAIEQLIKAGGKHLMVLTLPDATHSPSFKYKGAAKKKIAKENIMKFNAFVKSLVKKHKDLGINITLVDAATMFQEVLDNNLKYGFINTKDSCLNIKRYNLLDYLFQHPLTDECKTHGSDKYVFWGIMHPTTATHKILAEQIIKESLSTLNFAEE